MEKRGPWTTLSVRNAYESPWIKVEHHEVINPGNEPGKYGVVHFKNLAVGILPLDEDMNTWIIGQYRYPLDKYTWEIPEGGGDPNIPPIESAKRELREEAGIVAERWDQILEMHLSNSATDEYGVVYLARDLSFTEPDPDVDEELEIRKVPFSELCTMVDEGKVTDSLTVAAVLKIRLMQLENQL